MRNLAFGIENLIGIRCGFVEYSTDELNPLRYNEGRFEARPTPNR